VHLQTLRLERLHRVNDRLLQRLVLQAQHLDRALVVVFVQALVWCALGVVAARCRVAGQVLVLWEVLLDDLDNLLVGEVAGSDEEALVRSIRLLECADVCLCNVAYVDL